MNAANVFDASTVRRVGWRVCTIAVAVSASNVAAAVIVRRAVNVAGIYCNGGGH